GLEAQGAMWSAGFLLLAVSTALSGALLLRCSLRADAAPQVSSAPAAEVVYVGWHERLVWMALAFIPSGLVIAVTTYITTDVASAPFLWVVPLALFLATFILVFRSKLPFNYRLACHLLPACVLLLLVGDGLLITSLAALAS